MKLNLTALLLCLLGAVALSAAENTTESVTGPTGDFNSTVTEGPNSTATTKPTTGGVTTHPAITTITPEISDSTAQVTDPTEVITDPSTDTVKPTVEASAPSGLSPGAIAGITIGSIAGVAAIGGGVFGALKYTGRL